MQDLLHARGRREKAEEKLYRKGSGRHLSRQGLKGTWKKIRIKDFLHCHKHYLHTNSKDMALISHSKTQDKKERKNIHHKAE